MAGTVMECLHFAEHARPRMARNLLDDLHRVLEIRVDVDARLHRGIGTLAQYLTRQLVQFCERTNDTEIGECESRSAYILVTVIAVGDRYLVISDFLFPGHFPRERSHGPN